MPVGQKRSRRGPEQSDNELLHIQIDQRVPIRGVLLKKERNQTKQPLNAFVLLHSMVGLVERPLPLARGCRFGIKAVEHLLHLAPIDLESKPSSASPRPL